MVVTLWCLTFQTLLESSPELKTIQLSLRGNEATMLCEACVKFDYLISKAKLPNLTGVLNIANHRGTEIML